MPHMMRAETASSALASLNQYSNRLRLQSALPTFPSSGGHRYHLSSVQPQQRTEALHLVAAMAHDALAPSTWDTYRSAAHKFLEVCSAYGLAPKPVSFEPVSLLFVQHVVFERKCSASLSGMLTGVLRIAAEERWGGLPSGHILQDQHFKTLADLRKGLIKHFPSEDKSRLPITANLLRSIYVNIHVRHMFDGATPSAVLQLQWLYMLLCHQGTLRKKEANNLTWQDVHFVNDSAGRLRYARLDLRFTKTAPPGSPPMPVYIVPRQDELDATQLLLSLAARSRPSDLVFQRTPGQAFEPGWVNQFIRSFMATVPGIAATDLHRYSQYSLRHGGTTDMLDAGVPFEMVMQQGRWKSLSWCHYRHASDAIVGFLAAIGTKHTRVLPARPAVSWP